MPGGRFTGGLSSPAASLLPGGWPFLTKTGWFTVATVASQPLCRPLGAEIKLRFLNRMSLAEFDLNKDYPVRDGPAVLLFPR